MASSDAPILDQAALHLEFLGYQIDRREEDSFLARHPHRANIVVRTFLGGLLHSSLWTGSDVAREHQEELLPFLNLMNRQAGIARLYADEDGDVVVEALYVGAYERVGYGRFLDLWDRDLRRLLEAPDVDRYLG